MPIREEAINVFMGLPGDGDRLELTYNFGVDSYEIGTGYGHIAITVDDMDGDARAARGSRGSSPSARRTSVREGGSLHLLRPRSGRLPGRADRALARVGVSRETRGRPFGVMRRREHSGIVGAWPTEPERARSPWPRGSRARDSWASSPHWRWARAEAAAVRRLEREP